MLTKTFRVKCDGCGQFFRITNETIHRLIYPDSEFTSETWESLCARCTKLEKAANANG